MTSGYVGVAWSPVTQTIARSVGRSPSTASRASIVCFLICGSFVCPAMSVAFRCEKTNVSPSSSRSEPELDAGAEIGGRVVGLGDVARLEPDRLGQPEEELRVAEEAAAEAVALGEGRVRARAAPPLERDHVQGGEAVGRPALVDRMLREELDRLPRPGLGGPRRRARPRGPERLRPQDGVAVLEERVRVGHAVVGVREDAEDRLAAPDVRELEAEAVDLELGAGRDELGGVVLVLAALAGAARQPEPVGAPLGRPQRRECEDVLGVDLLPVADRLEHGAAGELLRRVAEHRPVGDLARRARGRARRRRSGRRSRSRRAGRGSACPRPRSRCGPPSESCARSASPSRRTTKIGCMARGGYSEPRHTLGTKPTPTRANFLVRIAVGRRSGGAGLRGAGCGDPVELAEDFARRPAGRALPSLRPSAAPRARPRPRAPSRRPRRGSRPRSRPRRSRSCFSPPHAEKSRRYCVMPSGTYAAHSSGSLTGNGITCTRSGRARGRVRPPSPSASARRRSTDSTRADAEAGSLSSGFTRAGSGFVIPTQSSSQRSAAPRMYSRCPRWKGWNRPWIIPRLMAGATLLDDDAGAFFDRADPAQEEAALCELGLEDGALLEPEPTRAGRRPSAGRTPSATSVSGTPFSVRWRPAKSRFRGSPLVRMPFRARSSAPSIAGKRSDSSRIWTPLRSAISCDVPEEAEAGDVRDGVHRQSTASTSAASLFSVFIQPTARSSCCVPIAPVLVPGHDQAGAERLRHVERVAGLRGDLRPDPVAGGRCRSRRARTSAPRPESCGRRRAARRPTGPSRRPPRRSARACPSGSSSGNAAIERARNGVPPIAKTSFSAFVAAIAP